MVNKDIYVEEREARSRSCASLLATTNLLVGKVPKRLQGARSTKARGNVLAQFHQ